MKKKINLILIALFWLGIFGFMLYKEMYAVVTLSVAILTMTLALANSDDN